MYMASQRPVPGDEYEEDYSDADIDTWGQAWDTLKEVFNLRLKPKLAAKVRIRASTIVRRNVSWRGRDLSNVSVGAGLHFPPVSESRNGRLGLEDERFWPRYRPRNLVLEVKSPDPHVLLQKVTVAPQSGWLVGHTGRLQWSVFNLRLTGGYNVRTRRFGFGYMWSFDTKWRNPARKVCLGKHLEFRSHSTLKCSFPEGGRPFGEEGDEVADVDMGTANFKLNKLSAALIL